jgi:ferritin
MNKQTQIAMNNLITGNDVNNSANFLRNHIAQQAEEIQRLRHIVQKIVELSPYSTIEFDFLKAQARAELEKGSQS